MNASTLRLFNCKSHRVSAFRDREYHAIEQHCSAVPMHDRDHHRGNDYPWLRPHSCPGKVKFACFRSSMIGRIVLERATCIVQYNVLCNEVVCKPHSVGCAVITDASASAFAVSLLVSATMDRTIHPVACLIHFSAFGSTACNRYFV